MPLITTTSDLPGEMQGIYDRTLLQNAQNINIYDLFAQVRPAPPNMGTRVNFKRFGKLPVNTTRLNEAVTPAGKKMSAVTLFATLAQYGDYITLSDWVQLTGLDANLLSIAKELLSEQMSDTKDILVRNTLLTGTNVRFANAVAARNLIVGPMTDGDVDSIIRSLETARAKKLKEMKLPSVNFNSVPIRPSYVAITHTHARADIEGLTGFTPVEQYSSQDALSKYQGEIIEIGEVRGIRFLATSNCQVWADAGGAVGIPLMVSTSGANVDVYGTLVFGRNAYGTVPLQKGTVKNIVKKLGSAGTEDPLDQRATSGWKMATTSLILNDDWMIRWEHACTAV